MAKPRAIVVFTWDGPVVVQHLGRADPDPTADGLARLAAAYVPENGGVRPVARVIERMPSLQAYGIGAAGGPAGGAVR
jgi:hypothetical protein